VAGPGLGHPIVEKPRDAGASNQDEGQPDRGEYGQRSIRGVRPQDRGGGVQQVVGQASHEPRRPRRGPSDDRH